MSISQPFVDILSARRQTFNNMVSTARLNHTGFDTEAFSNFLGEEVDAIVQAVFKVDPGRAHHIAEDLFEMAVNLVAQNRAGKHAQDGLVNRIWREVAPNIPQLILIDALESLGALTNTATYVSGQSGVRNNDWLDLLRGIAPRLNSIEQLRHLVTVVTWRSGGAHIRNAALKAASELPSEIVSLAIGYPKNGKLSESLVPLAADIWWTPGRLGPSQGHTIGGFVGLGGPFPMPPEIKAVYDGFLARSDDQYFRLSADVFGAVVQSVQAEDWEESQAVSAHDTVKTFDVTTVSLNMPDEDLKFCANSSTIVISSPHSHYIRVLPRRSVP